MLQQFRPIAAELREPPAEDAFLQQILYILAPLPEGAAHPFPAAGSLADKQDGILSGVIQKGGCSPFIKQRYEFIRAAQMQAVMQFVRLPLKDRSGLPGILPSQRRSDALYFLRQGLRFRDQGLRGRTDYQTRGVLRAPLGLRVEIGKGIDLIPPEFHAHRARRFRREDVQNAPSERKLAGTLHLHGALIAAADKGFHNLFRRDFRTCRKLHGTPAELFRGHGELQGRVRADRNGAPVPGGHPGKDLQPLVLVFVGSPLRIPQVKVPGRKKEGRQAHGCQILR